MCNESGGFLCETQDDLDDLTGRNLGCSLDNEDIWSEEDSETSGIIKFVRCCAKYDLVNNCNKYSLQGISVCSSYQTETECIDFGTGYARQQSMGAGKLLLQFQENCKIGNGPCKGLVEPWFARDNCIYCTKSGSGIGECRPGNDFGICQFSLPQTQALFALGMQSQCGPQTICNLVSSFPDLSTVLSVQTSSPQSFPGQCCVILTGV